MANEMMWRAVNVATAAHVAAYRATGGRLWPVQLSGSRTVLVDHVGRKSGKRRTTPLLYIPDGDDVVIVASKGGSHKHPAWWLNLREMDETEIQVGSERRRVTVRQATAEDKERLWPRLLEVWPSYEGYQRRSSREIPLAILSPAGQPAPVG